MGKSKQTNTGGRQVVASAPSSAPAPVTHQASTVQPNQQPQQLMWPQVVQVSTGFNLQVGAQGTNQLAEASASFEQITSSVLDKLAECNRTSLKELNLNEIFLLGFIAQLKEKQKALTAVVLSSGEEIENLKAAISEQVNTIDEIVEVLNQLWNRNNVIKLNTSVSKMGCDDLRNLIIKFTTHQKSLEQRIQELTADEERSRERIEVLEKELRGQRTTITTLTTQNGEHEKKIGELSDEISGLKKLVNGTETDQARLIVRQLLTQLTTLMYKKLFPKNFKSKKTYTFSEITAALNKLEKDATNKKDESLMQTAKDMKDEFDNMVIDLKLDDDLEATIIRLKESVGGNQIAHPDLGNLDNVRTSIKMLFDDQCIDDDEHSILMQFADKWERLK